MLPDHSGTYVLLLRLLHAESIPVGRRGTFQFPSGWYAYAGSAHGPGGLAARVARHLRLSNKALHWHVDYLRARARPIEIWYATGTRKRECAWARSLSDLPGASLPVPRFGASDCRCPAHLIHLPAPPDLATFARALDEPVSREILRF